MGNSNHHSIFKMILMLLLFIQVDAQNSLTNMGSFGLSESRHSFASTTNGKLSFFGGGTLEDKTCSSVVDILDSTVKKWSIHALSVPRCDPFAVSTGDIVIFGGGYDLKNQPLSSVDIYNIKSQKWTTDQLSDARSQISVGSNKRYAFFVGGKKEFVYSAVVDIYDSQTKKWNKVHLSYPRSYAGVACTEKLCIISPSKSTTSSYKFTQGDALDIATWSISSLSFSGKWSEYTSAAVAGQSFVFAGEGNTFLTIYNSLTHTMLLQNTDKLRSPRLFSHNEDTLILAAQNSVSVIKVTSKTFEMSSLETQKLNPTSLTVAGDWVMTGTSHDVNVHQFVCDPGSFSESGFLPCTLCPGGTYNDKSAYRLCEKCPIGYYSSKGSTNCLPCPPGSTTISNGQEVCICEDDMVMKNGVCVSVVNDDEQKESNFFVTVVIIVIIGAVAYRIKRGTRM
eukprot:TRINITY_DN4487_c0_g1_i1.p1 TRINITY_DN4487_c0_g1~~TRINITY_DN4487_c0_g1_i1.p1  ORF type:complete len:451 (+),score=85.36 TRINITY_DN4487_c0_g1_i1:53-1405(+)